LKTAINPTFPVAKIRGVDHLMAVALGMEHEAARRYAELAEAMRRAGEADMAALFEELAELEADHERQLSDWARRDGQAAPPPAAFSWQMPETMAVAGDEARVMTPYKALSLAVRNEERAFAFYSYLAAMAERDDVRERAEALAREELTHVAQLRAMRRKAYHSERPTAARRRSPGDPDGLHRLAMGLEAGSREVDAAAAAALRAGGHTVQAEAMARLAEEDRRSAELLARSIGGRQMLEGGSVIEGARAAGLLRAEALTVSGAMQLALRNAEEVLETYMAVAENATDEGLMREAQRLGELAVARLAVVRSLIADVED
jgi:rubrerythrin